MSNSPHRQVMNRAERQYSPLKRVLRALGPGRGVWKQRSVGHRPDRPLELYSTEACPACRRVRQALTELDLDFLHRSCPVGDSPNRQRLLERWGKTQVPFLVDPNTGVQMYESREIVRYLQHRYGVA